MRPKNLLPLLLLCAVVARAEGIPPADGPGSCVAASIDVLADARNLSLYRIVFVNHCGAPRSLFWCAENPALSVPAAVACPASRGAPAEPRHAIVQRKEFQWHLPRGSRIRFRDCPGKDIPTAGFGCAAP